jgi:hypothetical protein
MPMRTFQANQTGTPLSARRPVYELLHAIVSNATPQSLNVPIMGTSDRARKIALIYGYAVLLDISPCTERTPTFLRGLPS